MAHPALRDPGEDVAGQRLGQVIDLNVFRQTKCGRSSEGHQPRSIVVPGRKMKACTRCGARWAVSP